MAESRSILDLKRKALAMGLCGKYSEKWADATTQKELVELATDINGADFLCSSVAKGWGLSKDFLLRNFGEYINGRYIARQGKGYTSELYVGYNGVINVRTTLLIVLYSDATVYIPKNHACRVFSAGNKALSFDDDGSACLEYVEYTPRYEMKERDFGRVKIIDPRSDKSSLLNFGGVEAAHDPTERHETKQQAE